MHEELQIEYSLKYKELRCQICYYLILSGNVTNIFCYGYIIKDISSLLATAIVHEFKERYIFGHWRQPEIPKRVTTDLIAQKHSFIWDHLVGAIEYVLKQKHYSILQAIEHYSLIMISFELLLVPYIIAVFLVCIIADFMNAFCTEKQKVCCMSCCFLCTCMCIFTTIITFLLVFFLDILY